MIGLMAKSTSVNVRISPQLRRELQQLADYRGLTLSGLAHSFLVKSLRQEKQNEPEAFAESERLDNAELIRRLGGVELAPHSKQKLPLMNPDKLEARKPDGETKRKTKKKRVA